MPRARSARHAPVKRAPPRAGPEAAHAALRWAPLLPMLAALAGVGFFLQREWAIAGLWGFSLDDSWIHAVFARNIASGNGYAFNSGR